MEHKHGLERQIVVKAKDEKLVIFKFLRAIELSGFFEGLVEQEDECRGDIEIDLQRFESDDLEFVAEFVNSDIPNKRPVYEGQIHWTWGKRFDSYIEKWDLPLTDLTYKVTWSRRFILANFLQMDMLAGACTKQLSRLLTSVRLVDRWKDCKDPKIESDRVYRYCSDDNEDSSDDSDNEEGTAMDTS